MKSEKKCMKFKKKKKITKLVQIEARSEIFDIWKTYDLCSMIRAMIRETSFKNFYRNLSLIQ